MSGYCSVVFVDGAVDVNHRDKASMGSAGAVVIRLGNGGGITLHLHSALFSGVEEVTNNRMELEALGLGIRKTLAPGLRQPDDASISIWSDSKYALGCIFNPGWNPSANKDIILRVKALAKLVEVRPFHVRGHAGFFLNELADLVCVRSIQKNAIVDYSMEAHPETDLACLGCSSFPCETKNRWKEKIDALRTRAFKKCDKFKAYAHLSLGVSATP